MQQAGVFDGVVDFGSGFLLGVPNAGNLNTNPTPRQLGVLQEVQADFTQDVVELHGQWQYPVDSANAKGKIQIKAKYAAFDGRVLSDLWLGVDPSTGQTLFLIGPYAEVATVPANPGPYTVTVAQAASFKQDYGVQYGVATGQQAGASLVKQAGALSAAGQYQVNMATGIYTFDAADAGKTVLINYSYTSPTQGITVTATNQLMGVAPRFQLVLWNQYKTKNLAVLFYQVIMAKFSMPRKMAAYTIADFEASAFADSNGNVYSIYQDTHE